jgi:putative ABC transport system ATP-binding protein
MPAPSLVEQATIPLVNISNLTVRYEQNGLTRSEAVRGVTFSLAAGDTLVVLGPNGSGKTTLLRAIAGDVDARVSGGISLCGRSVHEQARHHRAKELAMVYQDPSLGTAAHLTLKEHCDLTAGHGTRKQVTWTQVQARLDSLRTTLDPTQPAGELSGGQRQLFALLLAVLSAPKILLLDEPTSALDARHAGLLLGIIEEFSQSLDASTILVTHDLREALQLGNRLMVLSGRGEVHALLSPAEKVSLDEHALLALLTEATSAAWTIA